MADQKTFLYYFSCLVVGLTCVIGSNEYDNIDNVDKDSGILLDSLSDKSKYYYIQSNENDVNSPDYDFTYDWNKINPGLENKMDQQLIEANTRKEDAAMGSQNQVQKTNNIIIDNVITTPRWAHLHSMALQPGSVKSTNKDEFHDLLEVWRALLISKEFEETNAATSKYVNKLSEEAISLYENLDKSQKREYLWPKEQGDTPSADMTTQFRKLHKLSLAYGTQGTNYYKNSEILSAVVAGLDFMTKSGRYDGEKYYGNWWDWQVGVPKNFIDIMMIINEELPNEKIQNYTNAISSYVPNTYSLWFTSSQGIYYKEYVHVEDSINNYHNASGSQTAELARTLLGLGILQKNKTKMSLSLGSTKDLLKLVTKGSGFYQDGSFIHHRDVPYTGLFGSVLVETLGEILVITKGSTLEIARDAVESFSESVELAFLPLIYQGEMIAPVKGLAISRSPLATQIRSGSEIMYNLLTVAKFASPKSEKKLKESVKYWVRHNPDYYLSKVRSYNDLLMTISLLNDSAIVGDKLPFAGTKMYASMDRFVQQTPNYALGLGLYSERISAYEAGNKENKRGWHTADGAMYLYNYDDVQFGSAYWPTVDPYKLPGTTVDTRYLPDERAEYCDYTSNEKWVGGVAKSNQAVVGMALNKEGFRNNWQTLSMDLKAKKSWFIVEGKIIALGAGITGTTTSSIETIVDNRLLNDQYNYKVLSDQGEIQTASDGIDAKWLLLDTDHQRSSIGYYFPNGESVNVLHETRSGSYTDINEPDPSNEIYKGTYRKFIIDHGPSPNNAKYAYVVLPGVNQSELMDYIESQPVNILENSAHIQAVELVNEGYLGMNVWSETGGTVAGISSNQPVSVMRQTSGQQQTYVLSDPTQSDRLITIKIPDFSRIETMSEGIYYNVKNNAFVVDFTNAGGAGKQFTVFNEIDEIRN